MKFQWKNLKSCWNSSHYIYWRKRNLVESLHPRQADKLSPCLSWLSWVRKRRQTNCRIPAHSLDRNGIWHLKRWVNYGWDWRFDTTDDVRSSGGTFDMWRSNPLNQCQICGLGRSQWSISNLGEKHCWPFDMTNNPTHTVNFRLAMEGLTCQWIVAIYRRPGGSWRCGLISTR